MTVTIHGAVPLPPPVTVGVPPRRPRTGHTLGEAILFTSDDPDGRLTVAVDVGFDGTAASAFWRTPIDVLLLTHNDSDHVGDVTSFVGETRPAEIWMPHDWYLLYEAAGVLAEGLPDITKLGRRALKEEVRRAVRKRRAGTAEAIIVSDETGVPPETTDEAPRVPRPDNPDATEAPSPREPSPRERAAVDAANDRLASQVEEIVREGGDGPDGNAHDAPADVGPTYDGPADPRTGTSSESTAAPHHRDVGTDNGVAGSVTVNSRGEKASATIRCVDAALSSGATVRWFDFDRALRTPTNGHGRHPWQASGKPGRFTVVNAWEVRTRPVTPVGDRIADLVLFLVLLAILTEPNRRALVALGHGRQPHSLPSSPPPPAWRRLDVLFASDSGFEFNIPSSKGHPPRLPVPWDRVGAVVGLHHGSGNSAHDHPYAQARTGTVLARSGNSSTNSTHKDFLAVRPRTRACTWCKPDGAANPKHPRSGARDVVLHACLICGGWRVLSGDCRDCPNHPSRPRP